MGTRPLELFHLFGELENLAGIGPKTISNLKNLSIEKPRDFLFTLPFSVLDRLPVNSVRGVASSQIVTVEVLVKAHKVSRSRTSAYTVNVQDAEANFQLVFFNARKQYLETLLPIGERRIISGKLELYDDIPQIIHPHHVKKIDDDKAIVRFEPIYPLASGISQKLMFATINGLLKKLPKLDEWIEPELLKTKSWPSWEDALNTAHCPISANGASNTDLARRRLAFDELFSHQLSLSIARNKIKGSKGRANISTGIMQTNVLKQLSFDFTEDQKHSIKDILDDLKKPERMNRLLQGDVGSGKTIVAFIGIIAAVEAGGQGAIMAPTEILARQHFETLSPLAKKVGVSLNLLTGRDKGTARNKKLIDLKEGRTNIIIGTHALFQADVVFKDLRLAVVDEQHRFGVRQRLELGKKGSVVDLLLMTATPIPRSLALAHYGDMDFSIIKQKPPGRKPINTALISSSRIDEVVDKLKNSLAKGAQAYWVCPLIEESEVLHYTAAERRFEKLRAKLGEGVVELVHGKMSSDTKDEIMDRFTNGETKLLVATTVIEVGVNVPKANIMVVENAEKFGLAQLHQLRGRVGRGTNQSTCLFLYKEPLNSASKKRLSILRETEDGFKISEVDLSLRGSGDAIGTAQSGLPRFRMANNELIEMLMETAHQQARYLLAKDPNLETPQGKAVRNLLWLMDQDKSLRLFSIG